MSVKLNKTNSDFQTAYFIAGQYHTADAAYIALLNQRQDREQALAQVPVQKLKQQAAVIRAQRKIDSDDAAEQLEGQAEMLEIESSKDISAALISAAEEELAFINKCIEQLQPLRKYAHLSDSEAAEACQAEEWALELQYRAENFMLTQGTIPTDHFVTMRQHPAFSTHILPRIEQIQLTMSEPGGHLKLIENSVKKFELPLLLGSSIPDCSISEKGIE